jgi:hypothetical protein
MRTQQVMKRKLYALIILLVLGLQLASAKETPSQRNDSRATELKKANILKHLRSAVKTADLSSVSYILPRAKS